jgi:crotonobetainyl-CoA:carnitine CoA-transferase CaiB-like acyl-CoA transferase
MSLEMNSQRAYAGLRVLDLGQGVAAPNCAMLLAMHGAEHRGIPLGVDVALPPAPRIREHGAVILAEIGIASAAIARLREENVLLIPKAS